MKAMKGYQETVKELYRVHSGELLTSAISKLQKQGLISKHLGLEDVLEGDIEEKDKRVVLDEATRVITGRKALGYDNTPKYHTSTVEYSVGDKITLDSEGKVYFSDINALYAARGRKSMNYVYKVSAEGNVPDVRDGWYYSRTPLKILKKWTVEDFVKEHPQTRFL